ncbi:MAG: CCA tRNA nucleotidyltransferase, partial [Clostridiales bacterium]
MTAFSIPEKIINKLSQNGYDAYFVGGCVRDFLRGEAFTDIDICTSATPEEVKKCFSEETIIETGIKHGTVTLLFCGESFEITTFRSEQGYNDSRHPSNVEFIKSINEDLSRRDFTMNAIALKDGIITDPFGGSQDIKNKIIRTVGNPDERFKEDALRILRALRFSSVLGFEIEEKTAESIFKNKELLCHVSKERIAVEFNKILLGKNVENILINYSSVIAVFIPEILQTINFNQHNPFHIYDVYTHIVKAVASSENNIYIRLTMFFHDMAKPQCFSLDNDGIGHFKKHADKSSDMAKIVLNRMKYD